MVTPDSTPSVATEPDPRAAVILVCGCDRTDERIVLCPEHDAMAAETVFGAVQFYGCRGGKVRNLVLYREVSAPGRTVEHMFEEESPLSGPVLETTRASVLSAELTFQLQVGNCIEALMLRASGDRGSAVVDVITLTAQRLRDAADDTSGGPRTVGQTASAVGVLHAAHLAPLSADDGGTGGALRAMAAALDTAAGSALTADEAAPLLQQLTALHAVLAGLTGLRPDEAQGRSRVT